jgi:hypothetical protein
VVRDILDVAWDWFKDKVVEIVGTVVDAVLLFVNTIVEAVDGALEVLWQRFAKPVLQTVFPILWRIFSFPGDVLEFVFGKVSDLFRFVYGHVSVLVHEVEVKVFDVTISAVRAVYDVVVSMFVNVYNAVRGLYVGVRDVTASFIFGTVRRIRERLHTIITVDLWILGCWKAFQGSLENFSFGDFLKTAVLCMVAPFASSYIAGIITSLTPTPGTEFPGFIPQLEFPELKTEDLPRFVVAAPPPVRFPTVGVSTLPYVLAMDLSVRYEVVGVAVEAYVLSDSVSMVLSDVWSYVAPEGYVLSDSVGLGLFDSWSVLMDVILLIRSVDVGVSYPAIVDVIDLVSVSVGVAYPAVVDTVDLVVSSVGVRHPAIVDVSDLVVSVTAGGVSYPATVDTVDLVVGAGVSVE